MKVYVNDDEVTIVGRDAALRLTPDFLFLSDIEKSRLSATGANTTLIQMTSLDSTPVLAKGLQSPVATIPDIVYEVGQTVFAGDLKENPPPHGTIIKTPTGRPLEYAEGQWHYGREKGSIDTHIHTTSPVTILSI